MQNHTYLSAARMEVLDARAIYRCLRRAWMGRPGRPGVDLDAEHVAADRDLRRARRWFDSAARAVRADRDAQNQQNHWVNITAAAARYAAAAAAAAAAADAAVSYFEALVAQNR